MFDGPIMVSGRQTSDLEPTHYIHEAIMQYLKQDAPRVYPGIMKDISRPWDAVLHLGKRISLKKGALFSLDESDRLKMVYVRNGKISISYFGHNGESHINLFYEGGSFFNESVAISGACHQIQTGCCIKESECYLFETSLLNDDDFKNKYYYLINNLLLSASIKVVNFHALLNVICTKKTLSLIAWYILTMCEAHENKSVFVPDITQREIAMLLGVDMSSMTRSIHTLKKEKVIETFTKKKLIITDIDRLKTIAGP